MTDQLLPTGSMPVIWRPDRLKYLLIGAPKWGKTTFFSGVKGVCLLAFEAGYAEVDCPKIVITSWDRSYKERKAGWEIDELGIRYTSAMEVVEELEQNCPYSMVVVDTLDMATKMASDHYCALARVETPAEGGDYGRGWELLQTRPVRMFYNRLVKLGIGVACITHSTDKAETDKFGLFKPKIETSLPGGIQKFAHTQSDVIMHGFFARRRKGNKERDRMISFDGNDMIMAGTRIRKVYIPNKYIVDPPTREDDSPPWKQWEKFFSDNPTAGQTAEQQFIKLYRGSDDETIDTKPETKPEPRPTYAREKENNKAAASTTSTKR